MANGPVIDTIAYACRLMAQSHQLFTNGFSHFDVCVVGANKILIDALSERARPTLQEVPESCFLFTYNPNILCVYNPPLGNWVYIGSCYN